MDEALVSLLIPISRLMLPGGVGINQLVQAAKLAYLKATIDELFPRGSRINISRLSVTTGLTRKEASLLFDKLRGRKVRFAPRPKEQRAMRVLRGWRVDPRFRGRSGQPAQLPLRGGERAFESLVRLYAGDVTPTAVLRELERMNAVSMTKSGLLRIRASGGRLRAHAPQHMLEVARLIGDFARTIAESHLTGSPSTFLGYKDCIVASSGDAALFQRAFSRRAAALLESFDQWRGSRGEVRKHSDSSSRVGIGVYLVRKSVLASPLGESPQLENLPRRRSK
jgi:Family of unknown function (DUF6502)